MISLLLLFFAATLQPLNPMMDPPENNENRIESEIDKGIEAFYRTDWGEATGHFKIVKQLDPENPTPYFFESMMPFLQYFFVDQNEQLANQFFERSEQAIEMSHRRLKSQPGDTTMVLMLSGLYGYRGLVAAGQQRHQIAIKSGVKGFNYTRKLLSIDSDRPDARIGRGMFYYMIGSVPSGMKWVTNMMGYDAEKKEGFNELKAAAENDSYIRNDALMMLMYLYDREGEYKNALHYAERLTNELPDNVIFLYKQAGILEKLEKPDAAMSVYTAIVEKNNNNLPVLKEKSQKNAEKLMKLSTISR